MAAPRQARMTGAARRAQIREIAAEEFARDGLHGASAEAIARRAGITQAYIFRLFGTKKNLFIEVAQTAFDQLTDAMVQAAGTRGGLDALAAMGQEYDSRLAGRTGLLVQLQGFAACGDAEVRDAVRECFRRMWDAVAGASGLDPVTVKTFLAFGMLLNASAAMELAGLDEDWAAGVRTRIQAGLFQHITTETNR
ncbi:MAG TPA: TetR/AcrR family transcriptional regulator [Streptosporangiaceae bacterium]